MSRNPFKTALAQREAQIGLWLSMAQPYSAEICASTGFQWLLVDGEHAPNDVRSMLSQLQAVAAYPTHPVVRVVLGEGARVLKRMRAIQRRAASSKRRKRTAGRAPCG